MCKFKNKMTSLIGLDIFTYWHQLWCFLTNFAQSQYANLNTCFSHSANYHVDSLDSFKVIKIFMVPL